MNRVAGVESTRAVARRLAPATFSIALVALVAAPADAEAQRSLGLGRRLTEPSARPVEAPAPAPRQHSAREEAPPPWPGPQIQLGYAYTKLHDGFGGGDVHAGGVGVFLQWPVSELRTGLRAELGSRDYSLGQADLMIRGTLELGFQLTGVFDPVVPFVSALAVGGGVVGQRFDSSVAHALGGAGVEFGIVFRLFRHLHLEVAFGYQRVEMDGAAFDLAQLRLAAGL